MFDLNFAVIHSFDKDPGTNIISREVKKGVLLDSNMASVISLVDTLNGLLGKPGNNVTWGQFANDGRQGNFPEKSYQFIDSTDNDEEFLSLSHLVLDELSARAKQEVFATGGHVLVSLYHEDGDTFLLVASIKQRDGLLLDDDLVPVGVSEIDLSKIHQAAKINLQRLDDYRKSEEAGEESNNHYLCFISKGDKEATGYFVVALGCTTGVASKTATANVIDLVYQYFRSDSILKPFRSTAKENVIRYLQEKVKDRKNKQPALLDDICRCAILAIPPESATNAKELEENLLTYLNNSENNIPSEFTINTQKLNEKARIRGKAPNWDLQFERLALGETPNHDVYYDDVHKKLTLSKIPSELVRMIENELGSRNN